MVHGSLLRIQASSKTPLSLIYVARRRRKHILGRVVQSVVVLIQEIHENHACSTNGPSP